ncbi:hypothetical protein EX895_002873 [Sporisorium graminicola]|uniref:Micro-fibrillar-associated protein 1 C-terminal domain-containing protein n=1 Tax=Sporisorium graminicola TaxID=280036 RepID=A0A4U7KUG5_9BASI|nr:hypothetical protein EX895_002873 [Sporisorium graminicola]TKY88163.1 hypothetical protein EX895_002873 [Sporisorium graminicola]
MAPPAPQKQASRVSRPAARYRPGKAPLGAGASLDDFSDSDASDSGHDHKADHDAGPIGVTDLSSGTTALLNAAGYQQRRTAGIVVNEAASGSKKLDLRLHAASSQHAPGEQHDDSSEYETDTDEEPPKPVFRKPGAPASVQQQTAPASDSSEYETDSEEESDEAEPAPKPMLKPIFVPKRARTTISSSSTDAQQQTEADAEAKAEAEAAARRKQAHDLAAATIKRSLAEKEHAETHITDVDDTDGLDPESEFEAWRQRELARLQRDRDALLAKRTEQQELETFRSLPEAEKERRGRERAAQQRAEKKEQRGNPAFMQKYYHKGSFFQDMDILKRDYTEKTTKDVDVSKLPKMMQVRNYGVKGRSKWTHLANEDTSKSAMRLDVNGGASGSKGCFKCGGPHVRKDCPEVGGGEGGSGANRAELPEGGGERSRKWGQSANAEDQEHSSHRRRSRSRSPRHDSSRYDRDRPATHSRSSRRYDDESSRRSHHDSRPHTSRDDRDRHKPPSSSSSRRHEEHRTHRDDHHDNDRSHRHHRDFDRRRSDDSRDRHKRRDRDGQHHSERSSKSSRDHESDRKRSRLDP